MDPKVKMRLGWVQFYERTGNFSLTSRRCGISRPTLRKWVRRYQELGLEGLLERSRRPKHCLLNKMNAQNRLWIGQLRQRRLGSRRMQSELLRLHQVSLSTATIHKVLKLEGHALRNVLERSQLKSTRRPRKGFKRYQKDIPGERVQMDVCKIGPKVCQFTAIDDCTRLKVVRLYPNKESNSTLLFLEEVLREFPFPVQRFQTDRGKEFMAHAVQRRLMALHIKFRPTKPRSPHLNGKVERTQLTDLEEFYSQVDLKTPDLVEQLQQWQEYYNRERRHGSIGKAPWQKWEALVASTPTSEQVRSSYALSKERIRNADYLQDIGKPRRVLSL
jgi:transposase InsO family protein